MTLWAFHSTDNQECQHTFVGLAGTRFVPNFAAEASAALLSIPLRATARTINRKESWVYAGSDDDVARSFYTSLDFKVLGPAHEYARGKTMSPSDVVLRLQLAARGSTPPLV
jgi:hypothetical protein